MVYVSFGNQLLIQDTSIPDVKAVDAKLPFQIGFEHNRENGTFYTVIIYDKDAPYPDHNNLSPYIHLFVYNMINDDLTSCDYLFEYESPNPPEDSPPHTYIVNVYKQPRKLSYERSSDFPRYRRTQFPLFSMTKNLNLVDSMQFTVGDYIERLNSSLQVIKSKFH
jgi:phosphatidylethanolamine-binding protein (PEBP) family uncharacterized protein